MITFILRSVSPLHVVNGAMNLTNTILEKYCVPLRRSVNSAKDEKDKKLHKVVLPPMALTSAEVKELHKVVLIQRGIDTYKLASEED